LEWLCQLRDYEPVSYFVPVNYVTYFREVLQNL
jgi:hypothetical protein